MSGVNVTLTPSRMWLPPPPSLRSGLLSTRGAPCCWPAAGAAELADANSLARPADAGSLPTPPRPTLPRAARLKAGSTRHYSPLQTHLQLRSRDGRAGTQAHDSKREYERPDEQSDRSDT